MLIPAKYKLQCVALHLIKEAHLMKTCWNSIAMIWPVTVAEATRHGGADRRCAFRLWLSAGYHQPEMNTGKPTASRVM
jgi:hypothetical protein